MKRPLVTASDIESQRTVVIPPGAILTPLARDLLRKRGIRPRAVGERGLAPRRLIVANWKSHKTIGEAVAFARDLILRLEGGRQVEALPVICPPFTALASLRDVLGGRVALGAQDVSAHGEGAHTSCVAARHLVDAGCRYAIVGHSERRHAGETDAVCRTKVRVALTGGLDPILCVGETLSERRAGRAEGVVSDQLRAVLGGLAPEDVSRLVLAYEPRWAIGTGITPKQEEVTAMLLHVRSVLVETCRDDAARAVPILYGGSVNERNASELLHLPECAGALIGGASLSAERFSAILAAG